VALVAGREKENAHPNMPEKKTGGAAKKYGKGSEKS